MAEETGKDLEKTDAARVDAESLDKILAGIDSLRSDIEASNKRMDAFEKESEDEKKADGEEDEEGKEKKADADEEPIEEKLEAKELAADSRKRKDSARADSISRVERDNADLRKRLDALTKLVRQPIPDADKAALTDVQSRADAVLTQFGDRAPAPMVGEGPDVYARRMAEMLKKHSDTWSKVNLDSLTTADAFKVAEGQIYTDALARARQPNDLKPGSFREVRTVSPTGHTIVTFHGGKDAHFVRGFTRPARHVRSFRTAS